MTNDTGLLPRHIEPENERLDMLKQMQHLTVSFVLAIVSVALPSAAAQDLTTLFAEASPAVVVLRSDIGQGSGFLLEPRIVVTNYHVIEGTTEVTATFHDGKTAAVIGVVGVDRAHDLAILLLAEDGPATLSLRDEAVQVGEPIVTIGAPEGLDFTMTEGIVSGLRTLGTRPEMGRMIQISAPISHGSSGGPLLDVSGKVVGINTLVHRLATDAGFAVPASRVADIDRWATPVPLTTAAPAPPRATPSARPSSTSALPQFVDPDWLDNFEPPADIMSRISPSARRLLRNNARFYLMLPDGRCANAYAALRPSNSDATEEEIQGIAILTGQQYGNVEGEPPPLRGEYANGSSLAIQGDAVNTSRGFALIDRLHPSPEQLAHAILEKRASLVLYSVRKNRIQRYKIIYPGMTGRYRKNLGPPVVVFTWKRRPMRVRFLDKPVVRRVAGDDEESPESKPVPAKPVVKPTHLLKMKDGREFSIRIVRDDRDVLIVDLIVGAIVARQEFRRVDIASLVELPDGQTKKKRSPS